MPSFNPSEALVKRHVRKLILADSTVRKPNGQSLVYRIRIAKEWPTWYTAHIIRALRNLALNGTIILLDENGGRLKDTASLNMIKRATGARLRPGYAKTVRMPAASSPKPPAPAKRAAAKTVSLQAAASKPLPMPQPVERTYPTPKIEEVVDMMVLELWLTRGCVVKVDHNPGALPVLAALIGLRYENHLSLLRMALARGLQDKRLDIWPQNTNRPKRIMVRDVPTARKVEALRSQYPAIAGGRRWPEAAIER